MGPGPDCATSRSRSRSSRPLLPAPAAAEVRILAFGDSLTQGYGLPEARASCRSSRPGCAPTAAPDVTVINAGVSGDTTAGGLARIDWALGDDVDAVIVALGGNDMLRGLDPARSARNLDGILDAIDAAGLPVLLAGLPAPPNYGPDYRKRVQGGVPRLAAAARRDLRRARSSPAWARAAACAR